MQRLPQLTLLDMSAVKNTEQCILHKQVVYRVEPSLGQRLRPTAILTNEFIPLTTRQLNVKWRSGYYQNFANCTGSNKYEFLQADIDAILAQLSIHPIGFGSFTKNTFLISYADVFTAEQVMRDWKDPNITMNIPSADRCRRVCPPSKFLLMFLLCVFALIMIWILDLTVWAGGVYDWEDSLQPSQCIHTTWKVLNNTVAIISASLNMWLWLINLFLNMLWLRVTNRIVKASFHSLIIFPCVILLKLIHSFPCESTCDRNTK